jgi:MFS family permease
VLPDVAPGRRRLAISAGSLAVLLAALDAYVIVTVFVQIITDLEIPIDHLERATPLVIGYLLGYVAGMPLLGRLSDRYGRRPMLHLCLAGFAIGSVVSASASGSTTLLIGRAVQGLAGGALLPITMALTADLFPEDRRPVALGTVGAAQELGSVLGPLYGVLISGLIGWRGIFWVNIPLAIVIGLIVQFAIPIRPVVRDAAGRRQKIDVIGGLLLAGSLALFVVGLYSQHPDESALPPYGVPMLFAGGGVMLLFFLWEWRAKTKLFDPTGAQVGRFLACLGAGMLAGAALMVTLVDVELFAQTGLRMDENHAALLLSRFLIALPVGAVLGGLLVRSLGERWLTVIGLLGAAVAYKLMSDWPVNVLAARHHVFGLSLPRLDVDLAFAGLGLGLVIAPLSSAILRVTAPAQHGVASSAAVVARMMGMLLGLSALAGWGLHRFRVFTKDLPTPFGIGVDPETFARQQAAYEDALAAALRNEYGEIFLITAYLCVAGAAIALLVPGKRRRAAESVVAEQVVTPAT